MRLPFNNGTNKLALAFRMHFLVGRSCLKLQQTLLSVVGHFPGWTMLLHPLQLELSFQVLNPQLRPLHFSLELRDLRESPPARGEECCPKVESAAFRQAD